MATPRKVATKKLGPTPKDVTSPPAAAALAVRVHVFHGRQLRVQMLTEGQIVVVKRLADRLQSVEDNSDVTAEQIFKWLDRSVEITMQILVDDDDREWLEGEILANRVQLVETLGLCAEVVQAYAADVQDAVKKQTKKAAAAQRVKSK